MTFLTQFAAYVFLVSFGGAMAAPAATPEATPPPVEAPLWLGNPGVDIAKARTRGRERRAADRQWDLTTTVGDYERVGQHDPRWDADARTGLENFGRSLYQSPEFDTYVANAKAAIQRALDTGCKDPLVVYVGLRLKLYPSDTKSVDLALRYASAEEALEKSQYSPIRKFNADARAIEWAFRGVEPNAPPGKFNPLPAGTNVDLWMRHARVHFGEMVRDRTTPLDTLRDALETLLGASKWNPKGYDMVYEPLYADFEAGWGLRAGKPAADPFIVGVFWYHVGQMSMDATAYGKRTDAYMRRFSGAPSKAAAAFKKAYDLDPTEFAPPVALIALERQLDTNRDRMETWFRHAVDADPELRTPYKFKMNWLEENDADAMLEFGRQCRATAIWETSIPALLFDVHKKLAEASSNQLAYWTQPEIAREMESLFTDAEKAVPGSVRYRSLHALYAYRARQWQVAADLLAGLGDKADLDAMGINKGTYGTMRHDAPLQAKVKPKPTAVTPPVTPATSPTGTPNFD